MGRLDGSDKRPSILIDTEEHVAISKAIEVLTDVDTLYQRNGQLVRIRQRETPPQALQRTSVQIEQVPSAALRDVLSEHARFISRDETGKEFERHVPPWLIPAIEARPRWPGIRELTNLIHEPCLRRDGSVVDDPGYDEMTGLLYIPRREPVKVDPFASRDDALFSIESLFEIVRDFPFIDNCHRAAWLAPVLTPFSRFAFVEAAPLFLVDANAPGTGKSTLADVVALIATGDKMPRSAYPQSDEEVRKLITSVAISGTRLKLFDNVAGSFGCASLDAALTGTTWVDRLLGKNTTTAPLALSTIWFATGNNVILNTDTCRRTLQIRLQSPDERPEERRDFAHPNLLRWVDDKREAFIRNVLTILRAYHFAGRPAVSMEPWGSFEAWSQHVRAPLVWCGLPDPALTRRGLANTADLEWQLIEQVFRAMTELDVQKSGLTTAELLATFRRPEHEAHRVAFAQWVGRCDGGFPNAKSLAMKLAHARTRIVSGLQLLHLGDRWLVQPAASDRTSGTTGSRSPIPLVPRTRSTHDPLPLRPARTVRERDRAHCSSSRTQPAAFAAAFSNSRAAYFHNAAVGDCYSDGIRPYPGI